MELVDRHLEFIRSSRSAIIFPPVEPSEFAASIVTAAAPFDSLSKWGEYPVDFLIAVLRLIQIQEKTNYPNGTISEALYQELRDGADIFTIVGTATWRGPES